MRELRDRTGVGAGAYRLTVLRRDRVRDLPGGKPTPDLVISSETLTSTPGSIRLRLSG